VKKPLTFMDVLGFAAGYWRRQPIKLAIVMVMLATASGLETYLPTALSNFLGAIREHQTHHTIVIYLIIFLVVYAAQTLIFGATYVIYNVFETRNFQALVNDAFAHVYRLSEPFFINTFSGSIISRINRARQKIEAFEDRLIIDVFATVIVLIGSMAFLAIHFFMLALLIIVYMVILITISAYFVFRISGPAQGIYANAQDAFVAHLADSIGGITTTKAYAREEFEIKNFFDVTSKLQIKNLFAYQLSNLAGFVQRVLLSGMLVILLGGGTWYLFQGTATAEDMAYLAFAYTIMQSYIQRLSNNIKDILTSSYDLHAVIDLMREPPEVADDSARPKLAITKGEITFDKVGFTYPGKTTPMFDGLSVTIRSGERIALVGHSGSGKTTFVRLLQCLYPLSNGIIRIDGQDVITASRHSLRSAIALVPQDPILFHRTLADNIAYGKPDADRDEIKSAAYQAHIAEFIESLPHKYETLVGERGIKLSGGERQRIAIARAILANRPILILDEATSSLDSASEKAIQDALHTLTHGRTSIMIAHRLSTIVDADRILVFDHGRIVEEGRHEDLIARDNGIYAGFFKLQSGGFIVD
jgi:ATP-binding cassette subfamily B protein